MCTYIQISSVMRATGESAEQPQLAPNEKVLNQPKPHPSDRTV